MAPELNLLLSSMAIGALATWLLIRLFLQYEARATLEAFVARFPGRCPICSLHNYGMIEGHIDIGPVKPHYCIEKVPRGTST